MNSADFLHADCEAVIFGQTDIVLYIFESLTFKYQSTALVLFWSTSNRRKGPMRQSLSALLSSGQLAFFRIGSLGFSEFCHGTRKTYQVVDARVFGKTFFCPNQGNEPKIGFLNFLKSRSICSLPFRLQDFYIKYFSKAIQ